MRCVSAGPFAKRQEARLLGDPDVRVGGVAEDEQVECVDRPGFAQRFPHRLQPRHDARGLLVIGRHQQRGARRKLRQRRIRPGAETAAAARQQRAKAGERAGERQRDPGEQREEQCQHEDRQRRDAVHREHAGTSRARRRWSARRRRRSRRSAAAPWRAANSAAAARAQARCAATGSAWRAALHRAALGTAAAVRLSNGRARSR